MSCLYYTKETKSGCRQLPKLWITMYNKNASIYKPAFVNKFAQKAKQKSQRSLLKIESTNKHFISSKVKAFYS